MSKEQELEQGKDVLVFYKKHQWDYVQNYSKRSISGFYAWYSLLVQALHENDYRVHENDYDLARANPKYPVGIVGTPSLISEWNLQNPAVLGPSMYDNPVQNPTLMENEKFKYYLLTCQWLLDIFAEKYGEKCALWFAGISTDTWPDTRNDTKTIDVLIYDKIRWERGRTVPLLFDPAIDYIAKSGLSYKVLQYGDITHEQYKGLLSKSRSMLFMCEHETQGIAYQEALASNVPIIAWDHGWWTDPVWQAYSENPIPATSVPMFSPECGEKFKMVRDFPETFDKFWGSLDKYKPREFIKKEVSFKKSAELYIKYYFDR